MIYFKEKPKSKRPLIKPAGIKPKRKDKICIVKVILMHKQREREQH